MDRKLQAREVDENYDAFNRLLSTILDKHRDQFALMRDRRVVGFYDTGSAAYRAGVELFKDGIFSIQEVTDEPIDLGFWSHVATH